MVSIRPSVLEWLKETFDIGTLNEMKEVAGKQGERVFGTEYSIEDYENDLTHHEEQMFEAEQKFEHYNDLRNDFLEDARKATNLSRKRYLAKAKQMRKRALKHVKMFVAHLEKFERKLDELTAHETRAIAADKNTTVDLDETAEAVNAELVESTPEIDSVEREEADKAIENELDKHSLDDKVSEEEEALRRMEEEDLSADEVSLEADVVDDFVSTELGEEPDSEEEDQVELNW